MTSFLRKKFVSNESYDWRKILTTVSVQLWNKSQEKRTSKSARPVCLMVDDTDYPKRGVRTELIGKIFSHVTHSMMLGFKGLFIGITDAVSQTLLDFALVGEEGKDGRHGLRQSQLDARFSKEHEKDSHTAMRIGEYGRSKIALMLDMIRRVIKSKIRFDYVLADSLFACAEVIRFSDYETVGGLFRDGTAGSVELTLTEKIWGMVLELVREIAECFNIEDEQILDMLVNRSDKLDRFVEIYQLKTAS